MNNGALTKIDFKSALLGLPWIGNKLTLDFYTSSS